MHVSTPRRSLRTALTSTLLAGALLTTAGAAQAGDGDRHRSRVPTPGEQHVLADGLVGPLSLAVGKRDTVYVSQSFAGTIEAVRRGERTTLVTTPEAGPGSLSTKGNRLYYTTSVGPGSPEFDAHLVERRPNGRTEEIADLGQHERATNPDSGVTYGLQGVEAGSDCAAALPLGYQASYLGGEDSNPYASTPWRNEVLVADAGANDILAVDRRGNVRTVAVLPPAVLDVTADVAAAAGLPDCAIGKQYLLESVPTDVEVGDDGWIYATSLPGGGEGPEFPPLGAVYRIHPWSGEVHLVARGFVSATNLAIGKRGEIYVTELFAGRVSVVPRGSSTPQTFLELPLPAAVEVKDRTLYVTTEALPSNTAPPSGKVVKVRLRY